MHAAAAPSNLDAAITMPSAQTQLQSTVELRAKASKIAISQPDLDTKAELDDGWPESAEEHVNLVLL